MLQRAWHKIICSVTLIAFMALNVMPSFAQMSAPMSAPGQMVSLSAGFNPSSLKGIKVYPDNPFRFDFILDPGDQDITSQVAEPPAKWFEGRADEVVRLIKYFLAALTIPEKDLWVNLSPYEKDRIIPHEFGMTGMGRDLLAQDYLLKQITASVMFPEGDIGKGFWAKVYQAAFEKYGTTDISVDTFNKVWIMPDKAVVFEKGENAFIIKSHLKVMLESDYLAASTSQVAEPPVKWPKAGQASQEFAKNIIREIILPALEKEVNEGRNFASLRQVYQSLILAAWFKKKIKNSILSKVYVDQKKIAGVNIDDPAMSEKIWGQYVEAFKKGAFNFIKEEKDQYTDEMIPRKYFAGGVDVTRLSDRAMELTDDVREVVDASMLTVAVALDDATQLDKAEKTQYAQQDLPDLYYGHIHSFMSAFLDQVKNKVLPDREGIVKAAKEMFQAYFGSGSENISPDLDKEYRQMLHEALFGSEQQNFAVAIAAWIDQQAVNNGAGGYFNIYLPRDGALGYTVEMALRELTGEQQEAGLLHLSRDSFGWVHYDWATRTVDDLKGKFINRDEFLRALVEAIRKHMDEDEEFKAAIDKVYADIELVYTPQIRSKFNNGQVRIIDSGFQTFPLLLEALIRDRYQVKTDGLVIQSSARRVLPDLNTGKWQARVRNIIKGIPFVAQHAVPLLGAMESDSDFLRHPFRFDSDSQQMMPESNVNRLRAYWMQMSFVLGTIRYQALIEGIVADLLRQGIDPKLAMFEARKSVRDWLGVSGFKDKIGMWQPVFSKGLDSFDPKTFDFEQHMDWIKKDLGKKFSQFKDFSIDTKEKFKMASPGMEEILKKGIQDEWLKPIINPNDFTDKILKDLAKEKVKVDVLPKVEYLSVNQKATLELKEVLWNIEFKEIKRSGFSLTGIKKKLMTFLLVFALNTDGRYESKLKLKTDVEIVGKKNSTDRAQAEYGGIDMNMARLDLQIQNAGGEVEFNIDPAMMKRLEAVPGFTPVVMEIKLLPSVKAFLGIDIP